jgi:hypothetical protein
MMHPYVCYCLTLLLEYWESPFPVLWPWGGVATI